MGKLRVNQIAAVIAATLALMCSSPMMDCQSQESKEYSRADMIVAVPRFSIAVRLSEQARQRLRSMHETVLVITYFDGGPLPGQGRYNAPFRDVYLGNDEKLVDDQNIATFDKTRISQSNWNRLGL